MGKSRQSANLVSDNNIFVDIVNDRVGIGTTTPQYDLDVSGSFGVSGIITASAYYGDGQYLQNVTSGVGVATAGGTVGTGATILDFRGAGISTVTVSAGIATINITGGGGGGGAVSIGTVPPSSPSNGDLWYSPDYGRTFVWYNEVALGIGSTAVWVDASPFNLKISELDDVQLNSLVVVNHTDLNTLDVSGISTLGNVIIGSGATDLIVNGNARVTGILTIGTSSLTLNGNTNQINGVTISAGIITASGFSGSFTGNATGLSGTPDITVRNITGAAATFTGNVSIAGTLTYEDVTNVDSIGLVTARSGAHVATTSGNLLVGSATSTGTASQPLQVTGGGYFSGSVGIGTTNPDKSLHIYTADGDIRIGDITEGTATTDAGIIFTGLGSNRSALFTEVNGTLLSYGINCQQITGVETGRAGGVFRFDTRTSGSFNGSNCFTVVGKPIGTTAEYSAFVVGLNDGNTYLTPTRGNVLVGTSSSTGTISQPLQVNGGAYVSGSVGIGTTNPGSTLAVGGTITELSQGQYWNVVTQADVGIGASQVPLNQYLGQLAFIDSYSPSGLRRDGGGSDDVVVNSSGNVLIGSATSTGTASQNLQVTGGAYVSGSVGIGTTNPTAPFGASGIHIFGQALQIQSVAPNIFLTETDNSNNYYNLVVDGGVFGIRYNNNFAGPLQVNSSSVLVGTATSTGTANQTLQVTGGSYVSGSVGIGNTNPTFKLDVTGAVRLGNSVSQGAPSSSSIFTNAHTLLSGQGGNYLAVGQYGASLNYAQWVQSAFQTPSTAIYDIVLQPLGGNVGVGSTIPNAKLAVAGSITELSNNQYWNVVTQADVGIGASQVPLNQYLGQLAFLDEFAVNIPQNAQTAAYTLVRADVGKHISITTGGVTVPSGVFEIGDVVIIYNNSSSNQTITQGASTTLRLSATTSTGNRTLASYGVATILCVASNTFIVYGSGVS